MNSGAARLGRIFRELREARGLSQEQLGDRANVHRTYVGKIERGEKDVSLRTASKLAEALGSRLSTIIDLFERAESTQGKKTAASPKTSSSAPRQTSADDVHHHLRERGARR